MRKITLIILTIVAVTSFGQEFSFSLYFEDVIGNKDTLILGYDENATNGLDEIFDEKDFYGEKMDSLFDVYITDMPIYLSASGLPDTFLMMKKQIEFNNPYLASTIIVKCKNYPIKLKWDKNSFFNNPFDYSLITDWHPGFWFDCQSPYGGYQGPFFMIEQDSVLFDIPEQGHNYYLVNADTVHLFYFSFLNEKSFKRILSVTDTKNINLSVYPNPFTEKTTITFSGNQILKEPIVGIYNINGQLIETIALEGNSMEWNSGTNKPGMYFYRIKTESYISKTNTMIKQ